MTFSLTYESVSPAEADQISLIAGGTERLAYMTTDEIQIGEELYKRHYDVDGTARFYVWNESGEFWKEREDTTVAVAFALQDQVRSLEFTIKGLELQVNGLARDYQDMSRRLDRMAETLANKKDKRRTWA